jgi:phenylalanyl-tRNA synthetase beta chain
MKFPESWLREFCDPPLNTQQLADTLTMGGFEVESLTAAAPPFSGVVVAEILEAAPHPNADKLRVCKVSAGALTAAGPLQIVCGAPNARAGIRVPLAMVGAALPPAEAGGKAFEIKAAKLRGVESAGMLCSARELGLSTDHAGLLELDMNAVPGTDIRQQLSLDDHVFELKLTPNLAHALSVYGVARELSALTGAPLKAPSFAAVRVEHDARVPVRIEATDLCGRFTGRVVRGVNCAAKTPAWMVERLARCGQRSVSALVDISNYVMFEFGRPSHIFDLDKIHEQLVVRWARKGEQLTLLNGQTVTLDQQVGVIADAREVESLAGIMGGAATAVSEATRNVYVEAAFWYPSAIQGRSRRFNFATDAGHRFERGVDFSTTSEHVEHITQLILDICGGSAGPLDDQQPSLPARPPVTLRVARAAKVIGMPISQAQCTYVMQRLGFAYTQTEGSITVMPPPSRFDIQIEEDLIEEVARIVGFASLPDTPPVSFVEPTAQTELRRPWSVLSRRIAALGYQETINTSFVQAQPDRELSGREDPIRLLNPIAADLSVMRTTLMGSLLEVLKYNAARRATLVRVFESGRVYLRDDQVKDGELSVAGIDQPMRVAGLVWGTSEPLQWGVSERRVDFYDAKGDVQTLFEPRAPSFVAATHPALHPGRCARIELDGKAVGFIGELHPRWRQAHDLSHPPILWEIDAEALTTRDLPRASTLGRQQPVWRDLSLVVRDNVMHDRLMYSLRQVGGAILKQATLFDVYRPERAGEGFADGEHSVALRLEWQDDDAALTDERVDTLMALVITAVGDDLGARLRG